MGQVILSIKTKLRMDGCKTRNPNNPSKVLEQQLKTSEHMSGIIPMPEHFSILLFSLSFFFVCVSEFAAHMQIHILWEGGRQHF